MKYLIALFFVTMLVLAVFGQDTNEASGLTGDSSSSETVEYVSGVADSNGVSSESGNAGTNSESSETSSSEGGNHGGDQNRRKRAADDSEDIVYYVVGGGQANPSR